jgi:hypothetical protein
MTHRPVWNIYRSTQGDLRLAVARSTFCDATRSKKLCLSTTIHGVLFDVHSLFTLWFLLVAPPPPSPPSLSLSSSSLLKDSSHPCPCCEFSENRISHRGIAARWSDGERVQGAVTCSPAHSVEEIRSLEVPKWKTSHKSQQKSQYSLVKA